MFSSLSKTTSTICITCNTLCSDMSKTCCVVKLTSQAFCRMTVKCSKRHKEILVCSVFQQKVDGYIMSNESTGSVNIKKEQQK